MATTAGSSILPTYVDADIPSLSAASRFVRLLTGSSRLAVFASHTAVIANGSGDSSRRAAKARTTGVSSTAVVSRLSRIVVSAPIPQTKTKSRPTLPPATRDTRSAACSKTSARSASSAKTVTATRNPSTGPTRAVTSPASFNGSRPVTIVRSPATAAAAHTLLS